MTESTQDIFNGATTPENQSVTNSDVTTSQEPVNVFNDKLNAIKTEDGKAKYETVDKALDALANAQTHIPKLETENKELRERLEGMQEHLSKVDKLEDIVTRLNSGVDTAAPQQENQTVGNLEETVNQVLNQRQAVDTKVANINQVSEQMISKYGDKVQDTLVAKATELGVTVDYLQNTAAESPKMFMAMFGGSAKSVTPMTTSVQTSISPTQAPRQSGSMMAGSTTKDLLHEMAALKEEALKKYGL